ncbi:hypothetical protein [Agrobacterium tumefaciens]|uniref:hypothetical protein n=1 Tax=Agrobacterium tumefaciens TaxID=358 RepID=UPI001571AE47|nr:hypothetical protein [Agrobacterium tumefaciens]
MALRLIDFAWTATAEGYALAVASTVPLLDFERDEIAAIIEGEGFKPTADFRWTAPADANAPARMWEAMSATGYNIQMDTRDLPPSLAGERTMQ